MSLIPCSGEEVLELLHQVARLGAAGVPEQREREEDQRDRREQPEVGDHRGEVGPPVGVELRHRLLQRSPHARSIVLAMDAASALADLTEISTQVEAAVLLDESGAVLAAAPDDSARSERLARTAVDLLAAAHERSESSGRTLTQLEAALREGSVFVARDDGRSIVAVTGAAPTSGLVFYDLRACLRTLAEAEEEAAQEAAGPPAEGRARCVGCLAVLLLARSDRSSIARRRAHAPRARAPLLRRRLDGHARAQRAPGRAPARIGPRRPRMAEPDELGAQLREHALLEGDFLLRSASARATTSTSTASRRFPSCSARSASRLAAAVREFEPDARPLAGPGARRRRAGRSRLAFVRAPVRDRPRRSKGVRHGATGSKASSRTGELVCLIEDVVTSGGALAEAVGALREAGLVVRNAVCVVDREEGGADALARIGVRLRSLYRAGELVPAAKTAANRMVEP